LVVADCGNLCALPVLDNSATLMFVRTDANGNDRDLDILLLSVGLACLAIVLWVDVALRRWFWVLDITLQVMVQL
jgi:hypothetical protein